MCISDSLVRILLFSKAGGRILHLHIAGGRILPFQSRWVDSAFSYKAGGGSLFSKTAGGGFFFI